MDEREKKAKNKECATLPTLPRVLFWVAIHLKAAVLQIHLSHQRHPSHNSLKSARGYCNATTQAHIKKAGIINCGTT